MRVTLLAALLLSSAAALAGPNDELSAARQQERAASVRVSYYEMQAVIAERDMATARIIRDTASRARDKALREHDSDAAGAWSRRHAEATTDEREAQGRAAQARAELATARDDLQASADRIRRLERSAKR